MKHSEVESRSCPFFLSGTSTVCGSFQQDVLARVILGLSCVLISNRTEKVQMLASQEPCAPVVNP